MHFPVFVEFFWGVLLWVPFKLAHQGGSFDTLESQIGQTVIVILGSK